MRRDENGLQKSFSWRRVAWIATGVVCLLLLIFHRPLLFGVAHRVANHFAARENLKADFRLEGNPFGSLTIRNVHVSPTGPTDVESIDVDLVHVDYGLITLIRHGLSDALRSVEVRSARVVLNPAKARLRPRPPNPEHKITLPGIFPRRDGMPANPARQTRLRTPWPSECVVKCWFPAGHWLFSQWFWAFSSLAPASSATTG